MSNSKFSKQGQVFSI